MRNGDYTVDIWVLLTIEEREFSDGRNLLCFMTGAHAGGDNQNKVGGAIPVILSSEAHKGRTLIYQNVIGRRRMQGLRQIANDRHLVGHIVVSNLLTWPNPQGSPDWLTELQDKSSFR